MIVCADDFAIAPGVSAAILSLVEAGRISATSCMTSSPDWSEWGRKLKAHERNIDLGLHLTLSGCFKPLSGDASLMTSNGGLAFSDLVRCSYFGSAAVRATVDKEIHCQIDAFVNVIGRFPDYVDGHQYAHQLPVVRDATVSAVLDMRRQGADTYIRSSVESLPLIATRGIAVCRASAVSLAGGRLKRLGLSSGVPTNDGFTGIYDFGRSRAYGELVARFALNAGSSTVMVCHPGVVDDALLARDQLTYRREDELAYLSGDTYGAHLKDGSYSLNRFRRANLEPTPGVPESARL